MKLPFSICLAITAGLLALVFVIYEQASAQQKIGDPAAPVEGQKAPSKALPDGGPPPRLPDGHPDLTGHWYPGFLGKEDATLVSSAATQGEPLLKPFDPKVTPEKKPSFQPWAIEKMKETATGGEPMRMIQEGEGQTLGIFRSYPRLRK